MSDLPQDIDIANPAQRRWLLLQKALETVPLAQAIELAQQAESFLSMLDDKATAKSQANGYDNLVALTARSPDGEVADRHPTSCTGTFAVKGRKLSGRETEILRLLMQGFSNKHIARVFNIAEATVKVHVKGLLRKIGVSNRTQAAMWAAQHLPQPAEDETAVVGDLHQAQEAA